MHYRQHFRLNASVLIDPPTPVRQQTLSNLLAGRQQLTGEQALALRDFLDQRK